MYTPKHNLVKSGTIAVNTLKSICWTHNNYTQDPNIFFELGKKLPLIVHPEIKVYGKVCHQNRSVGFFSNTSAGYKYSGQIAKAIPMDEYVWLICLMEQVNNDLGTQFNGALVNLYQDGSETIGAHSDDEKGLSNGTVASLSFGVSRIFRIKSKKQNQDDKFDKYDLITEHGQLLVMEGNFQKEFTHEIPRQNKINLPRLSITFRCHTE